MIKNVLFSGFTSFILQYKKGQQYSGFDNRVSNIISGLLKVL